MKAMRTQRIAMVFQKFALMPWLTVAENVSLGLEMQGLPSGERKKRIDDKLELVGLSQWRDKRPDALSGGMQQRVGLARALAMDADILLMDEPFSALDPLIRQGLQDELLDLQRKLNMTIVFVSHDLDEALKLGNNIVIMKGGQIVQHSKPEDIVLNPANDYVRAFVAHTNPLNVLSGHSLMRPLAELRAARWRDLPGQRGRHLAHSWTARARCAAHAAAPTPCSLQHWSAGDSIEALKTQQPTVVNANIGMRDALHIRYQTGQKLVLSDGDKLVGILGDRELYHALLGKAMG